MLLARTKERPQPNPFNARSPEMWLAEMEQKRHAWAKTCLGRHLATDDQAFRLAAPDQDVLDQIRRLLADAAPAERPDDWHRGGRYTGAACRHPDYSTPDQRGGVIVIASRGLMAVGDGLQQLSGHETAPFYVDEGNAIENLICDLIAEDPVQAERLRYLRGY